MALQKRPNKINVNITRDNRKFAINETVLFSVSKGLKRVLIYLF